MIIIVYLVAGLLLLIGIAVVAISLCWKPQQGKSTFVAFAATFFIGIPVFEMVMFAMIAAAANASSWELRDALAYCSVVGLVLLLFASALLLIIFTVLRLPGDRFDRYAMNTSALNASGTAEGTANRRIWGSIWDTQISQRESISILRRREWAFLIDISPAIGLAMIGSLIGSNLYDLAIGFSRGVVGATIFFQPLVFIYILLKDSVAGVSIGKKFTDCRVVDFKTGRPISTGQSFLRNFLLAIPPLALIELAAASFRPDRRRFGDLIAKTIVVKGPPAFIDGIPVDSPPENLSTGGAPVKHALDD